MPPSSEITRTPSRPTDSNGARSPRPRRVARLLAWNVVAALALFFAADLVISNTSLVYRLIPDSFRLHDARIHHTLAKNVADGFSVWGPRRRAYATNSLGFRDAQAREVPLHADKPRVLFIGDSFTEGEGLAWDKTFVGLFQARFPGIDVLNAGVTSYSESIYWKKIADLLDQGLGVDHVIIYVDISDVQDEAIYSFDQNGNVVDSDFLIDSHAHVGDPPQKIQRRRKALSQRLDDWQRWLASSFRISRYLGLQVRNAVRRQRLPDYSDHLVRSMWTVEGTSLPAGYGDLGVDGALQRGIHAMDELAALLRGRGIKFSVGVYPWPDQLKYGSPDNRQETVWRSWCETNGCARFIDHFPDFFALKSEPDWQAKVYIDKDVHFNERGSQLVADRLIAQTRDLFEKTP